MSGKEGEDGLGHVRIGHGNGAGAGEESPESFEGRGEGRAVGGTWDYDVGGELVVVMVMVVGDS